LLAGALLAAPAGFAQTSKSGGATTTAPPAEKAPGEKAKSSDTKSPQAEAKVPPQKGMVWVNTKSKVFHKEGDRWYGKTKEGKFMTEADALKAGYHESKEGAAKSKESAAKSKEPTTKK